MRRTIIICTEWFTSTKLYVIPAIVIILLRVGIDLFNLVSHARCSAVDIKYSISGLGMSHVTSYVWCML